MNRQLGLAIAMLATTGCSSFDDDVFPHVANATVTAVPAEPDSLAAMDISLRIVAGPRAEHEVALERVSLERPTGSRVRDLDLAFPDTATLVFHAGDEMTVGLVNVGTTNGELTPLCGQTLDLAVLLDYPDTVSDGVAEWTGGGGTVAIACN
jgi:hypothetical protein